MKGLFAAALAEVAIITWRDLSEMHTTLPIPSDYVAVAVIFGGLSFLPDSASGAASLFGWGVVLATFLNLWSPQQPLSLSLPGNAKATSPGRGTPTQITQGAA